MDAKTNLNTLKIKIWRDPYDMGFNTTKPKEVEILSGLTVLVGCNGAGKTTLLRNIKEKAKEQKIPCHMFDNLSDGGSGIFGAIASGYKDLPCDNMSLAVSLWSASEGEAIKLNIGRQSTMYKEFLKTGYFKNKSYEFSKIFNKEEQETKTNKRILLFDATDSGMSIDAICEIKSLFNTIIEDAKKNNIELYIIISANEYELCRKESCFDVNEGEYITFTDYEHYRNFILKNRQKKEKRIEKSNAWVEKQRNKEMTKFLELKESCEEKAKKLQEKLDLENRQPTWRERDILNYKQILRDFVYNKSKFLPNSLLDDIKTN